MSAHASEVASVKEVKSIDRAANTFDGHKADLYINTGKLGGRHFMVTVKNAKGEPTLIAIHL